LTSLKAFTLAFIISYIAVSIKYRTFNTLSVIDILLYHDIDRSALQTIAFIVFLFSFTFSMFEGWRISTSIMLSLAYAVISTTILTSLVLNAEAKYGGIHGGGSEVYVVALAMPATTQHLLRQTLHEVSGRLGEIDKPRGDRGDLPAQSGAGSRQHHGLQQVQTDRNLAGDTHASAEGHAADSGEVSGLHGYYAALMAAARISLSPRDAAALIRNLKNQKIIAIRAAKDRRRAHMQNKNRKAIPARPGFAPSLPALSALRQA
jgi:hypothetical protein